MNPGPGWEDLVQHRLLRAREALAEAELLFDSGHLNTCVNRLYYACFYAVTALLASKGESSSKHSGVRAIFNQRWVKTGQIPREAGRFYSRLFDLRQEGDYVDFTAIAKDEAAGAMQEATQFVGLIEKALGR